MSDPCPQSHAAIHSRLLTEALTGHRYRTDEAPEQLLETSSA